MARTALPGKTTEEKLQRNHVVDGDCWRWTGAHTPQGYGQLNVEGKLVAVHRLAYEAWVTQIPDGLEIDHLCRVRDCINPAHLEPVTHAENLRRATEARTACKNGHPFAGENVRITTRGDGRTYRACLACRRASQRAYKARRRARG
jgi:hypothetical protein